MQQKVKDAVVKNCESFEKIAFLHLFPPTSYAKNVC